MNQQEYLCGCGHRFTLDLGAYGCPNCCGEKGPARMVDPQVIDTCRPTI